MYDLFYRHLLAIVFTTVLACMFWGGYIAGSNGWPWAWAVLIPLYFYIFSRFKG